MNQLNTDLSIKPKGINARIINEFGNLLHQCDSINYKHQNNRLYIRIKINKNSTYQLVKIQVPDFICPFGHDP